MRCLLLDSLHNFINLLKLCFLASFSLNFLLMCTHMTKKFLKKSAQKPLIFSSKASYVRGLFLVYLIIHSVSIYSEEEMTVCLETNCPLESIYLNEMENEDSIFNVSYLQKLQKVLEFDFSHNGATKLFKGKTDDFPLKGLSFEAMEQTAIWKKNQVDYVLKTRVNNKKLEARLLIISKNMIKSFEGIDLSGNLNDDRRKIHLLADAIHQALFNKEGIASTKFLYAIKEKNALGEYESNIFEADYDGQNVRQVTKNMGYCISPLYVPAKKGCLPGSFFYVSYKTGQSKIYVASLKDGKGIRLNDFKGNQMMPAITIFSDKLAFISDYTGNPDLFLQPFSKEEGVLERPQQIFALKHATQGSPAFSPDGKKIAFVSNKDGSPKIYVMTIPEKGASVKDIKPELVTKINRENSAPSWSPDGLKLVYCSMVKGFRQIFVYDFETKEEAQITEGSENKENPTFAKNSLHFIFNSTGKNGGELFLMNLNQPKVVKISQGPGEKHFPSFQP